jgi:hypothetical protein
VLHQHHLDWGRAAVTCHSGRDLLRNTICFKLVFSLKILRYGILYDTVLWLFDHFTTMTRAQICVGDTVVIYEFKKNIGNKKIILIPLAGYQHVLANLKFI